jgi:type IV secretory pathway VirB6-like protein
MPEDTWHFVDFLVNLDRGTQAMLFTKMGILVGIGERWFAYLTLMAIVSCGVLAWWRDYDLGMTAERFRSLVIGIAITYSLLQFYDTPLPSNGMTFPQTIDEEALQIANEITGQTTQNLMNTLGLTYATLEEPDCGLSGCDVGGLLDYGTITLALLLGEAAAYCVMLFGHVGQGTAILVGPLFIPWLMVPKLAKLFWGWLTVLLTFAIYPIVAAAIFYQMGNALTVSFNYAGSQGTLTQVFSLPVIFAVMITLIYSIFKIPQFAYMLVHGVATSHGGEFVAGFVARALAAAA